MDRRAMGSGLEELLSADAVLPEQYWHPRHVAAHSGGERALMWAVLADGIDCYRRNAHTISLRTRSEFREAERWIFKTDWNWPFSFVNLCETFGFDPTGVRRALLGHKHPLPSHVLRRQRFRPVALSAA